jgi:hypothetical protein
MCGLGQSGVGIVQKLDGIGLHVHRILMACYAGTVLVSQHLLSDRQNHVIKILNIAEKIVSGCGIISQFAKLSPRVFAS